MTPRDSFAVAMHGYSHQISQTVAIGLLLALSFPHPVLSSTTSEMFRTQAVFDIGDGKFEPALVKLNQALAADADDQQSRYYRGLVYSRLGRYLEAHDDLKELEAEFFAGYSFELGYIQYRLDDFSAAVISFQQDTGKRPQYAPSYYYLGLSQFKFGDYAASLPALNAAKELNQEFAPSADYLRADALTRLNRLDEAEALLQQASVQHSDSVYAGAIQDLLGSIRQRQREQRRFKFTLLFGGAYDSNVGLFADDKAMPDGIDSGQDQRLQLDLDAGVKLWKHDADHIDAGYRFFNSQHSELDDYDVRSHDLSTAYRRDTGFGSWGAQYRYRVSELGGAEYNKTHFLLPNLAYSHANSRLSLVQFQWRRSLYDDRALEGRDSTYREVDYRHFWMGGANRHQFLGLRYGLERANDPEYNYHFMGATAGIQRDIEAWRLKGKLTYEDRDYTDILPARHDKHLEATVHFIRPLNKHLDLEIGLTYIEHPSSWASYDYNRNLATVAVRWQP